MKNLQSSGKNRWLLCVVAVLVCMGFAAFLALQLLRAQGSALAFVDRLVVRDADTVGSNDIEVLLEGLTLSLPSLLPLWVCDCVWQLGLPVEAPPQPVFLNGGRCAAVSPSSPSVKDSPENSPSSSSCSSLP